MTTKLKMLFAIIGLIGAPAISHAAGEQVVLNGTVMVEKTIVENGQSRVEQVEPKVVVPGDRLLFATHYSNVAKSDVTGFVVTSPVPSAVTIDGASAAAQAVSVDGGKSFGSLAQLVVRENGTDRPALASDVTHIRWSIARIPAGGTGEVQYRATVR